MRRKKIAGPFLMLVLCSLAVTSCSPGTTPDDGDTCEADLEAFETSLHESLDDLSTDADFTLILETVSERTFTHSTGASTPSTSYRSASTSKLVTSVLILDQIGRGGLSLDSHPQDFIVGWPVDGNLSEITLRHLLSFTSGLETEPLCISLGFFSFENCVDRISEVNSSAPLPGERFFYGPSHMQVAGLMAVKAGGYSSWTALFDSFRADTGLFPTSRYDLPSPTNPRLAGGMHWTAAEYHLLLGKLFNEELLSPSLIAAMRSDHVGQRTIEYSPALEGIGEDWHYGLGVWLECHSSEFDCVQTPTISSAGAYGAYPFIDYDDEYFGILAREGGLTTFDRGYRLFETMSDDFESWSGMDCG